LHTERLISKSFILMDSTQQHDFIMPAEWFPQSGVQLTWPHAGTDWHDYLSEITDTYIKLTAMIAEHESVVITSPDREHTLKVLNKSLNESLMNNIKVYEIDSNDTWARDHGLITLVPKSATAVQKGYCHLLNFCFNGWGKKFPADLDNAISEKLYFKGALCGMLEDHNDIVLEGGSIESDGKGTIFTTSCCLLAKNRNQPMSRKGIEKALKQTLQAERIVWLNHGQLMGDDTDGHIDTIVRCAPNDTLLYIGCDDNIDPHYDDFKALEAQLQSLKTLKGTPYRLLKLPMADAIYEDEERLPATYANFLIINGAVIYPTYNQKDNDDKAKEIIQQAFPDRKIVGIDARTVIRQHGSIHCLTMQFPQGVINNNAENCPFF
jgi:agmatine/peptidylarginine deiminase